MLGPAHPVNEIAKTCLVILFLFDFMLNDLNDNIRLMTTKMSDMAINCERLILNRVKSIGTNLPRFDSLESATMSPLFSPSLHETYKPESFKTPESKISHIIYAIKLFSQLHQI